MRWTVLRRLQTGTACVCGSDTDLLVRAGAKTGAGGAVLVDETMALDLPHVWAARDCVMTHHRS